MRTRTRRRCELPGITLMGDLNEPSISGHVERKPVLHEDDDHRRVCGFVLTHTSTIANHARFHVTRPDSPAARSPNTPPKPMEPLI
jgi:hypothetical protein